MAGMPTRRGSLVWPAMGLIVVLAVIAAGSGSAAPPTPAPTQIVGTLTVDGVHGGEDEAFPIEIRSFDVTASKTSGKPSFKEIRVVKRIDSATPRLLEKLALGTTIPEVEIIIFRPNTTDEVSRLDYATYTLQGAVVDSVRDYASGKGTDIPLEEVSFTYSKLTVRYEPQEPSGKAGPDVFFCWNVQAGTKC